MCLREGTQAKQSSNNRDLRFLCEGKQLLISICQNDPMTRHNEWAFRFSYQFCGLGDSRYRSFWSSCGTQILNRTNRSRWTVERFAQLQVFGDIDQHRTRTTTTSKPESLVNNIGQVFYILYQKIMLGDRLRHPDDIGLLKSIAANKGAPYLPGDCQNWRRVHVC